MRSFVALALLALLVAGCGPDLYEGMPEHVERRHVPLEGAANFRDLGGYATEDGRRVRWGRLYRSDALGDLTDEDLEVVSALGIKLVCDFRSPLEVEEAPDRLPATAPPELVSLPILDEGTFQEDLRARITSGDLEGVDWANLLVTANRAFVTDYADRYARMFERITRPEALPALIHCTGGKDRAGFGSAVILRALGVPEETVVEDFLLTNHYTAAKIERILWIVRLTSFFQTDPEPLRPVLGVERRYIEAAFDQIEQSHGSFEAFRRDALGMSDAETEAFRALMLEESGDARRDPQNEIRGRSSSLVAGPRIETQGPSPGLVLAAQERVKKELGSIGASRFRSPSQKPPVPSPRTIR